MKILFIGIIAVLALLSGCCSFEQQAAKDEFNKLKPNCEIIEVSDYECSGTSCECWYAKISYKERYSESIKDTTLQFWSTDGGESWILRKE